MSNKIKILLKELDSTACEEFLETLHNYAGDKLSSVVCGFELRAPTCQHDMTGAEARTIIAYGAGARSKSGSTNPNPITIEQNRLEMIAEEVARLNDPELTPAEANEKAKLNLWPAESKGIREKDRAAFHQNADALFAYAENRMAIDIRSLLNSDERYQQAKALRCVVGFIESIRAKCAVGTNNAQANREALEAQLRVLQMEGKLDAYLEFKNKFLKVINSLRKCIDPAEWNEEEYVNRFLAKLDQHIFFRIHYFKIGPEPHYIKGAISMDAALKHVDTIYDALKTSAIMSKRYKDASEGAEKSDKSDEFNVFYSEEKKRKQAPSDQDPQAKKPKVVCPFYRPGDKSSCKFGDKCNRIHMDSDSLSKLKALKEQIKKIMDSKQ